MTEGKVFPLTSRFLAATLRNVMNVYAPKTTQRPQTMPNAKKNLREIGRLRSHCMAEALSLMSRSLHRQRAAGLEGLATAFRLALARFAMSRYSWGRSRFPNVRRLRR